MTASLTMADSERPQTGAGAANATGRRGYRLVRTSLPWVARVAVLAIFFFAAVPKVWSPEAFALAVYRYQVLPATWVNAVAIVLPWIEIVAVLALLVPKFRVAGSLLLVGMLLVFTMAMVSALARGIEITCGCFSAGGDGTTIGWWNIARNLGLIGLVVVACLPMRAATATRPTASTGIIQ